MSDTPIALRRLLPEEDAALYREIRLEALRTEPDAFSSTFESEQTRPLEHFAARLRDAHVVAAFRGPAPVGVAGFYIQPGPKHGHKGMLWGMYVRPAHRASGIGRLLVAAIVAHASRHVELLQLFVIADNLAARALYRKLGFVEYGIERHATKYQGRYHDDVLMARSLVVESAAAATGAPTEDVSA